MTFFSRFSLTSQQGESGMNRTEATAVYVVVMFALVAGAAQKWAVNSPRVKALIASHHQTMTAPQAPELAHLTMPAMENLRSLEIQTAAADAHRAEAATKLCNRTQIRLAMAQARMAARELRLHEREMRHQWVMVTPANFSVRVQPPQVEISNP
jgi:hypothetical protein